MQKTSARPDRFSRAEYDLLPESFPAELIDGEFVKEPSPTPWHQGLVLRIARRLEDVVGIDRVLVSPIDVFVDEWNVLQPDVLVRAEGDPVTPESPPGAVPILAIEILSPSTARKDRDRKTAIYLRAGVREVWLVDPDAGAIQIHTPTGVREFRADAEASSAVVPGFRVSWKGLSARS